MDAEGDYSPPVCVDVDQHDKKSGIVQKFK